MKSSMCIDVEFLAGTDLTEALDQAAKHCMTYGYAFVKFDFNGTKMSISANVDIRRVLKEYPSSKQGDFIIS